MRKVLIGLFSTILPLVLGVGLGIYGVTKNDTITMVLGLWILTVESVFRKMDSIEDTLKLTLRFNVEKATMDLAKDQPFFKEMLAERMGAMQKFHEEQKQKQAEGAKGE